MWACGYSPVGNATGSWDVRHRLLAVVGSHIVRFMSQHPNVTLAQTVWDSVAKGDYGPALDGLADEVVMENGPGAGPWHRAEGKEDVTLLLLEFSLHFGDSFRQEGTCVFADDRMAVCLVHETGTSLHGSSFDNMAVYVTRLRDDGLTDRIWTTDLDAEHCETFWRENPGTPSKDFGRA
jgi:hypothetical protein